MRLPRFIRIVRVFKIISSLKVIKESKLYDKVMKNFTNNKAVIRMMQGLAACLVVTHIFACFWFMASKFSDFDPDTWVYRRNLVDEEPFK